MMFHFQKLPSPGAGLIPPLFLLVGAAVLLTARVAEQPALLAESSSVADSDGDGLVDDQEHILGTSKYRSDSDLDGYSDLEEFARGSSPIFAQSVPDSGRMHMGMSCRGGDGMLHAVIALYFADGELREKDLEVGVLTHRRMFYITESMMLEHARLSLFPGKLAGSQIAVIDIPFPARYVNLWHDVTVFATAWERRSGIVQAAASIHLMLIGGTPVLVMPNPMSLVLGSTINGGGSGVGGVGTSTGGVNAGTIYVPLSTGGGADQTTWIAGEVCVQQTQSVSVNGSIVTQEVTSSECQEGWDGYCPPSCSSSVGSTFTTVDPMALIGG
jgi:hypothetical protein